MISIEIAWQVMGAYISSPAEKDYIIKDAIGKHLSEDTCALLNAYDMLEPLGQQISFDEAKSVCEENTSSSIFLVGSEELWKVCRHCLSTCFIFTK